MAMDGKKTNRILGLVPVAGDPTTGSYNVDGMQIGYALDPERQELRLVNMDTGMRLTRKYPTSE